MWKQVLAPIVGIVAVLGTVFAMSDRYIALTTFSEFKEYVVYRLDTIDNKLDKLIENQAK